MARCWPIPRTGSSAACCRVFAGVRTPMWAVRRSDTAADLQFGERFLNHLHLTETNRSIEIVAIVNVCKGSQAEVVQ